MKLYESITKSLKESKNDPILQEIYDNLQAGISYGEDMDKEHHSWITYPYFDAVLYRIENNGRGEPCIGWRHYGSSANPNTIEDLNWIITTIFEMTPEEFVQKYIKNTESKLEESCNKKELKEMDNSDGLTIAQFEEYCKDKLANLGTVPVKNWDDKLVKVRVAFEQPIRNYGMCKVLDGEDTMNKSVSSGETLEFVDEKGVYHESPMISPITLVGRLEFDKIDKRFYKSVLEYWDDIEDLFEGDAYDTNEDARPTPAVDRSGEPYNDGSRIDPRTGERFFGKTVAEEYQAEVDKCLNAYNNKDLDTAYKAWCQLHEILDSKLDNAGPKDEERFPLYKEWQAYIDKIPKDMMYEITDYGKNKIYAEEYGLKEADGSRLLGGRYRTMSELRDLFKEYADHFETKGNRIKGNTPEDSYNRGWELGKADAYKLAAFEIENNVDPALLSEATNLDMNTTSLYIDINELAKYAELYLQEKLGYANVYKEPGKQYTYMVAIRRDDDSVDKYIKLQEGLFNESEKLNEGNYLKKYYNKLDSMSDKQLYKAWLEVKNASDEEGGPEEVEYTMASDALWEIEGELARRGFMDEDSNKTEKWKELEEAEKLNEGNYGNIYLAEVGYNGVVGTCRGIGNSKEEAKENAFKLFKQEYPYVVEELMQKEEYANKSEIEAVEEYYGLNTFDMSSGAANESGSKLNEADLGYKEKLGGDPEDYISDIQSIKDKLNELDTDKFATKLAYEVWEQFDDTCDYQIKKTKDIYLSESEKKILAVESWTFTE